MRKRIRNCGLVVAMLLSACTLMFSQGGSITSQIIVPTTAQNGTGQPASYAIIQVCPSTATGFPCSPLTSTLYSDPALTNPVANPTAADVNGNYGFFLPTGSYIVQETNALGAGYTFQYSWLVFINGTGTVSSIGLSLPSSVFLVSNSPVTSTGTLTGQFISQNPNTVFGNCSGSSAIPAFCSLIANQLPSTLNASTINGLTVAGR